MPDIRLHALSNGQTYRSVSLLFGGVHIRIVTGPVFQEESPLNAGGLGRLVLSRTNAGETEAGNGCFHGCMNIQHVAVLGS